MKQRVPEPHPRPDQGGADRQRAADERRGRRARGTSQGGFGLVNAVNGDQRRRPAPASVDHPGQRRDRHPRLRRRSWSPSASRSTSAPSTAADLTFTALPAGVTSISVGKPIAVDDPTHPTQVAFPITFTVAPNADRPTARSYSITAPPPARSLSFERSTAGKPLSPSAAPSRSPTPSAPGSSTPRSTAGSSRSSSASRCHPPRSTRTRSSSPLTDSVGNILSNLNNDPRFKISYNTTTNTVTLDYSGLNQTQMPTGFYKIVVLGGNPIGSGGFEPGVTDVVGNKLDGEFYGVFPSGDGDVRHPPTRRPSATRTSPSSSGSRSSTRRSITLVQAPSRSPTRASRATRTRTSTCRRSSARSPQSFPGTSRRAHRSGRVQRPARRQPRPRPARTAAASRAVVRRRGHDRRQRHVHAPRAASCPKGSTGSGSS